MPRKPSLGPRILRIEGLSDGREVRPSEYFDDLSQQWRPMIPDTALPRVMVSAADLTERRQRAKLAAYQQVLIASGIWPGRKPKTVELVPKGKRKISEIAGKAILVTNPTWRRL